MTKLSTLRFLTGLVMASSAAALCIAPACTVSSGSDDTEGGAGGDSNTSTGGTATGGTSTGGTATGGAPAGGVPGEGGDAGATATGGVGGETAGGAAGDAGAAGAGGASGKVCTNPTTEEISAKGDTCAVYCSSYLSTCAAFNASDATFADEAECLTRCEFFDDAQLCCRAYHVRNAAASASAATTHCPHAGGNDPCN